MISLYTVTVSRSATVRDTVNHQVLLRNITSTLRNVCDRPIIDIRSSSSISLDYNRHHVTYCYLPLVRKRQRRIGPAVPERVLSSRLRKIIYQHVISTRRLRITMNLLRRKIRTHQRRHAAVVCYRCRAGRHVLLQGLCVSDDILVVIDDAPATR